jgi:hypothetical protein
MMADNKLCWGIDPLNVAQLQEIHSNRSTLPANVFVIQTELGNGKVASMAYFRYFPPLLHLPEK